MSFVEQMLQIYRKKLRSELIHEKSLAIYKSKGRQWRCAIYRIITVNFESLKLSTVIITWLTLN